MTINNLLPGPFDTDRLRDDGARAKASQVVDEAGGARATNPSARFGSTDEFGAACAFPCSVHAGFIVGQNLLLDGGIRHVLTAVAALMIDLYYWTTPNGHKITIFPRKRPLTLKPINISKGEQFDPAFLRIAPNNRIPAIVDHAPADGGPPLSLMESGAILEYLAIKCGQLLPEDFRARWECLQWLHWQMGNLGPMAGQNHHFALYAVEKLPYAIDRYVRETGRLYRVLDRRLADRPFLAGDYSIADIAHPG
jgi:GST-like protein